jgi:hypothetical protein
MKTTETRFNKTLEKLAILRAQINFQCLNLFNKGNK